MQLKDSLKSMDLKSLKSISQNMCKILFPAWEQMDNAIYVARRDLNMLPGKLAAQVSSAFLIEKAKELDMIEGVDYFPIVDAGDFNVYLYSLFLVFNMVLS